MLKIDLEKAFEKYMKKEVKKVEGFRRSSPPQ
jgi:hypothetical protein